MRHLFWAVPVALLAACTEGNSEPRENATPATRNFATGAFESVSLEGPDAVRVVRGPRASVVASGRTDVLDRLDIRVEGGALKIGRERENGWRLGRQEDRGATIVVTTPIMRGASIAGAGDLDVDHGGGETFDASIAGAGNLTIGEIVAKRADLSISGAGDLRVAGRAESVRVSIAGAGDIDAARLGSAVASVSIAGSGNARVAARQSADVSIVGSGDVEIAGTRNCKVSKLGSGEVRCTG